MDLEKNHKQLDICIAKEGAFGVLDEGDVLEKQVPCLMYVAIALSPPSDLPALHASTTDTCCSPIYTSVDILLAPNSSFRACIRIPEHVEPSRSHFYA